jgi:hypothetical protein
VVPASQPVLDSTRPIPWVIDSVRVSEAIADHETAQCASYYYHLIFATAWNISADIALLVIPLLIIPKSQLPRRRKILISCVLGLGVFNVSTAVCTLQRSKHRHYCSLTEPRYSQPSSTATTTSPTQTRWNISSGT